jgi:hypothetical protein
MDRGCPSRSAATLQWFVRASWMGPAGVRAAFVRTPDSFRRERVFREGAENRTRGEYTPRAMVAARWVRSPTRLFRLKN